jgi:hypothetical protein
MTYVAFPLMFNVSMVWRDAENNEASEVLYVCVCMSVYGCMYECVCALLSLSSPVLVFC